MGFDMRSHSAPGHEIYLESETWERLFDWAVEYGWFPRGTHPGVLVLGYCKTDAEVREEEERWPGWYFTNDTQYVDQEDAAALADALQTALDDIPGRPAAIYKKQTLGEWLAELGAPPERIAELSPNILSYCVTPRVKTPNGLVYYVVEDFISFCRKGEFGIY